MSKPNIFNTFQNKTSYTTNSNKTPSSLYKHDLDSNYQTCQMRNVVDKINLALDTFTRGKNGKKYSLAELNKFMEQNVADKEGDYCMIDISEDQNIDLISEYINVQRNEDTFNHDTIDDNNRGQDNVRNDVNSFRHKTIFIIDTNIMLTKLATLEGLRLLHEQYGHLIVIPIEVVRELDGLKNSKTKTSNGREAIGVLARWASEWIYRYLANKDKCVILQKMDERVDDLTIKDDAILDCCIFFKNQYHCLSILISNDKLLCVKALGEEILTISSTKEQQITSKLIAEMAYIENQSRFGQKNEKHTVANSTDGTVQNQIQTTSGLGNEHKLSDNNHSGINNSTGGCDGASNTLIIEASNLEELSSIIYDEIEKVALAATEFFLTSSIEVQQLEAKMNKPVRLFGLTDVVHCVNDFWINVFALLFKHDPELDSRQVWNIDTIPVIIRTNSVNELREFVYIWSRILVCLYLQRDTNQQQSLEILIKRWQLSCGM
ncbi:mRNA-processing endoribonuclease SCDLUD_000918 [Saccharomycodes ludwigii]|uniref:mRNA-processing endoribonuclease n=1 Tax=Saccharomycodes ludwigii TaxID=36035 RepID=UPI001E85767C|nr:hypothetical protein SCDLUD_000918 [Saccharomycodes ludwigii]KAH3903293.1 hypothetical protein SCDLUD_000918 [Saccharomycodes ludwigii]